VLEDFILRVKETFYADLARARLEVLRKQRVAAATPGLFEGSWFANAVSNCQPLANWQNRFTITASKILGQVHNGKISGRVAADGSFQYTVPASNGTFGIYTGKLQDDTGTGTVKYPNCTGSIKLNRLPPEETTAGDSKNQGVAVVMPPPAGSWAVCPRANSTVCGTWIGQAKTAD